MTDTVIPLPDGGTWIVRAFLFQSSDAARAEWERIEEGTRGKGANFSIWRTMNPERTEHYIVLCGRPGTIPEVRGGEPYQLHPDTAKDFALRRARTGADWFEEHPDEHHEQRIRYGEEHPVTIDPETGGVRPWPT